MSSSAWDLLREADAGPSKRIAVRVTRGSDDPHDRVFEDEQHLREEFGDEVAEELLRDGYADIGDDEARVLTPEAIMQEIDKLRQLLAKLRF